MLRTCRQPCANPKTDRAVTSLSRAAVMLTIVTSLGPSMTFAASRPSLCAPDTPQVRIADLSIAAMRLEAAACGLVDYCRSPARRGAARAAVASSVNGQIVSICASDRRIKALFDEADILHCDGEPLVKLSRLLAAAPFPERVATTDLFPAVARRAAAAGASFYMLGATPQVNRLAVARTQAAFPDLRIVGAHHGYFTRPEEPAIVAEIARLAPDIVWVALGAPLEQEFCLRHRDALASVGVLKTAGGLFEFLSGAVPRAPVWMREAGLEWLFRMSVDPRRLFLRYLVTNPHALYVTLKTAR